MMLIQPAEKQFEALFYDGLHPVRHTASLELEPFGVTLHLADRDPVAWQYEQIRFAQDGSYGEPVRMELPSGETIIVESARFMDSVNQFRGVHKQITLDRRGWPVILFSCMAIVVIAAAYYAWGVRFASEFAARFMPRSVQDRMGRSVIAVMAPQPARCKSTEGLQTIVDRLSAAAGRTYRFQVFYVNQSLVNAFAAPGGYIVVYRGLLDMTREPEEFAGVLSHEMEHVILNHSTRAVAREFSGRALLSLMAIDSNGTPTAVQAAAQLANLSYQRSDEQAADLAGAELLSRAGMRTNGLASFLRTVERNASRSTTAQYLSTHPATYERVEALQTLTRKYRQDLPTLMSAEAWESARRICRQ